MYETPLYLPELLLLDMIPICIFYTLYIQRLKDETCEGKIPIEEYVGIV